MSFPQPSADGYMVGKYGFFRLNTLLSCPGDIYESTQGGHVFCVGPESDIANINLAYFDSQVPTFVGTTTISPTRSFVGEVLARNESNYAPSQRPGRILYWADDIYDPNFRPRGFGVNDTIEFVAPRLDVVQYFTPLSSVVPPRIDKSFVFQDFPGGPATVYLVVPYYGRKYCYINFTNRNTTSPNTFGIIGVNYAITQDNSVNPYHQETILRVAAPVAPNGGAVTRIIKSGTDGMFDALVFSTTDAGPAPLRIVMSDLEVP